MIEFQSAHPVRGATAVPAWWQLHTAISIHAPRAGCDMAGAGALDIAAQFQSTHPVRGATMDKAAAAGNNEFQSTRPVWGATPSYKPHYVWSYEDFNPRAPCGARPLLLAISLASCNFNPRAPCGARPRRGNCPCCKQYFNPRAPCGARLQPRLCVFCVWDISIHAPRVGRDTPYSS